MLKFRGKTCIFYNKRKILKWILILLLKVVICVSSQQNITSVDTINFRAEVHIKTFPKAEYCETQITNESFIYIDIMTVSKCF